MPENDDTQQQQQQQDDWKPPASQADLDRIISERLNRERSKFSDYDDLKAAKDELDRIKGEQKTEIEKANEKLTAAETARQAAEQAAAERATELLKYKVAATKGISGDELKLLAGTTEQDLNEAADVILKLRRGQRRDPGQGTGGEDPTVSAGLAEARRRFGDGTKK